jgi:3-oxoacyl-[acyl-carrier protein] reductase
VNPFDLTGKVAIVTGAGSPSGIGFASAALLTELGAAVLVTSTTDRVQERAMELRGVGREVVAADLTDPAGAQTIVDVAVARWDHIDILINNAGMTSVSQPTSEGGELEGMSLDTWQDGLRRNLDTTFLATRAALPAMNAGSGRVVMVGSVRHVEAGFRVAYGPLEASPSQFGQLPEPGPKR